MVNRRRNQSSFMNRIRRLDSNSQKTLIIACSVFLIIFIITFALISRGEDNYKKIKIDKNKFIIYTKYQTKKGNYVQYIPFVNIKSSTVDLVNQDIDLFMEDFKDQDNCVISYQYNISGIVMSILLKAVDYNTEYAPRVYFRSYNINLSNQEVINNDSLLALFNTDYANVSGIIENRFKYYYQDIVNNEYYASDECDYNCFLKYREVDDYLENVSYYVENGDLYAYKPFVFYSIYGEENYFTDDSFEILVAESEKT